MSLATLGLAGELSGRVAVNSLWPRTIIATAAIRNGVTDPDRYNYTASVDLQPDLFVSQNP